MSKKNHSRVFKQRRVWTFMRKHPEGVSRRMIMEQFQLGQYAASNMLQRMFKQGSVTRTGSTRWPTWFATDKEPEDRRGLNTASLRNIERGAKVWVRGLVAAAVARGRDPEKVLSSTGRKPRPPKRVAPTCALAECWLMPNSRTQPARNDRQYAGEVAPKIPTLGELVDNLTEAA